MLCDTVYPDVRGAPSFIQETMVAGKPVDTHVKVWFSSLYIRSVIEGDTASGDREIHSLKLQCLTIESMRIQSHVEGDDIPVIIRNSAGVYPLV